MDKIGFFEKKNADGSIEKSLGRILMAITAVIAWAIAIIAAINVSIDTPTVSMVLGMLALAITGKVVSAGLEAKK